MNKRVLSVAEAAQVLGISAASAYEAVRRGQLPHVRIGGRILIPLTALEHMLDTAAELSIQQWMRELNV